MVATQIIINTEILNNAIFDDFTAAEKLDFLAHPSTLVFGVYVENDIEAAGVFHFNSTHIFVRYLVGAFHKHIKTIDTFAVEIGKTLKLDFVAMEYQRDAIKKIGKELGYEISDNELVKGI